MHTYEERIRAVELYIKLGKRVNATIRELGYPTKNTLTGWYREYERLQDLPMGSAPRPPKFSEAQKQVALQHYASHGRCISLTMRALGYPGRATLTAWVREAFPESRTISTGTRGPGDHSAAVKQAAVVGLYCREESAEALAKKVVASEIGISYQQLQKHEAGRNSLTIHRLARIANALEVDPQTILEVGTSPDGQGELSTFVPLQRLGERHRLLKAYFSLPEETRLAFLMLIEESVTCHGIFPPPATRVRPKEGTDNEANDTNRRADHRHPAGA